MALSHIPIIGMSPVSGFRLSCMAPTDPFEVTVVETAHVAPAVPPVRSSLPSRFMACSTGSPANAAVGSVSRTVAAVTSPA